MIAREPDVTGGRRVCVRVRCDGKPAAATTSSLVCPEEREGDRDAVARRVMSRRDGCPWTPLWSLR